MTVTDIGFWLGLAIPMMAIIVAWQLIKEMEDENEE